MNHSIDALVRRHGIPNQYLRDSLNLLITMSLGVTTFAPPLQAMWLTCASSRPMLPTGEQQQSATVHSQTHHYKVTMVIVRGHRRISSSTIRAHISTRLGDTYTPAKIERDVTALRNTGYFDDVRAETKDDTWGKDGKIVMFFVREKKELVLPKTP